MKKTGLRTAIIGAGAQATIITEIFELNGQNLIGYISTEPKETIINGYPVLCSIEEFLLLNETLEIEAIIISIGDISIREKIFQVLQTLNLVYVNAIHPKTVISKWASLGNGILVNAGVIIHARSYIGDHCNIGTSASIDHDCMINSFVNIAPQATLCGGVVVGKTTVIGPNATILEKRTIGDNVIIGAGAVVIEHTPDEVVVVGVPAKIVKKRIVGEPYLR